VKLARVASTVLPTRWGVFQMLGFERPADGSSAAETAVVLIVGDPTRETPLVRIHSQCFTGDALRSLRCDCGDQLDLAMRTIAQDGCGLLIYEHQEGRGIGLMAKLQAYALQDAGLDTIAANHALGFDADGRDFSLPVAILQDLGICRVRLLSNNPDKLRALTGAGVEIIERVPCEIPPNPYALLYLRIKKERMGHTLTLV
jgi:GTP cyclohydrolase II